MYFKIVIYIETYIWIFISLPVVKYGYFEYFFWGHGRYFNLILNVLRSHWRILNRRVTWSNLCCQLLFKSLYRELPQSISVLWRWLLGSVNWKNAQPTSWELCLIQQTYWRHKLGRWPLIALRDFSKEVREELGYAGVFAKTNKQTKILGSQDIKAGSPLQYSCLENPMDRGGWRAVIHGVTQNWTRLSNQHFH